MLQLQTLRLPCAQVKSPNILLTGSNKPYAKLGDLGLARMPGLYAASMDDTLKGTFNWLAPEMILNSPNHEVQPGNQAPTGLPFPYH